MASFPALQPSSRSWVPGNFGLTTIRALSGAQARISHASTRFGDQLQLIFENRTEADAYLIANHYNTQGGGRDSFTLPTEVYAGLENSTPIAGALNLWVYQGPPEIEQIAPDVHTVSIALERVAA